MRISAKADYAVRAAVELASAADGGPVKGESSPARRRSRLASWRTSWPSCATPASSAASAAPTAATASRASPAEITVADVIRAVEGPLLGPRRGARGARLRRGGRAAARRLARGAREPAPRARAGDAGRPRRRAAARRTSRAWRATRTRRARAASRGRPGAPSSRRPAPLRHGGRCSEARSPGQAAAVAAGGLTSGARTRWASTTVAPSPGVSVIMRRRTAARSGPRGRR